MSLVQYSYNVGTTHWFQFHWGYSSRKVWQYYSIQGGGLFLPNKTWCPGEKCHFIQVRIKLKVYVEGVQPSWAARCKANLHIYKFSIFLLTISSCVCINNNIQQPCSQWQRRVNTLNRKGSPSISAYCRRWLHLIQGVREAKIGLLASWCNCAFSMHGDILML